ncbi:gliding motility-associated-like protein [Flavobacterium sp. 270]|uniref:T9SS type B sorting domain-containing protein n=1 Tax=Flavobacterium sp. 270 TaxID=2512114 RepID=UPI0010649A15|nr:choice-of-anchor L domain-containing protein [Flavobacterium sp. 270]TDW48658.1 gliding motility-associated-like protein [Flavobacterium sp. 270]
MSHFKTFLFFTLISCAFATVNAQNITVDPTKTPAELVQNVLINSSCLTIDNINASGTPEMNRQSYASFSSGGGAFPFANGVVLSTSPSKNVEGPFNKATSVGVKNESWLGDEDLNQALNISNSTQATVLEFDFVASTNFISFNYIFASNEYQSYYPCEFTDGFAFLIKEVGSPDNYKNLAVLPNTTTAVSAVEIHPKIDPVTFQGIVKNGCDAINENYFNGYNTGSSPINYAGQTKVMNAQTDVIPNKKYHLKLVIADDNTRQFNSAVFLEAGSFSSKINFGQDRTTANNNPPCFGETVPLNTQLDPLQYDFKWYKNGVQISGINQASYNVTETGTFKVEADLKGTTSCTSVGEIKIEFTPEILSTNSTLVQCDDNSDGFSAFNLSKADNLIKNNVAAITVKGYYESLANAQAKTNAIATPEKYTNKSANQIVFARLENQYGCYKIAEVTLQISNKAIADQAPVKTCDGDETQDGLYQFDLSAQVTPQLILGLPLGLTANYYLTQNDAIAETNALPNIFKNTTPNSQIIYARVANGADCYDIKPITLVVNTFNPPNFQDEEKYVCKGEAIDLAVANTFSSYLWNDTAQSTTNTITVSVPGNYSVKVTDANGCEKTKNFKVVLSEPAVITDAVIKDFAGPENSVVLQYTGVGNYEFSLDGIVFQNEPNFDGVNPGIYRAIARDKNGCGLSNSFLLYVLDYPRFFTPNGDGYNDVWYVKNIDQLPDYIISIFDRYGKFLKQMNQNGSGWNGIFNGQQLPADDYWFTLLFVDGKTVKGHFSLKR